MLPMLALVLLVAILVGASPTASAAPADGSAASASASSAAAASASSSTTQYRDAPEYKTVDDLAGKRIGIIRGSVYGNVVAQKIRGVTTHELYSFTTVAEGILALKTRQIDALVEGTSVGELAVSVNSGVGIMPQTIAPDEIGMCSSYIGAMGPLIGYKKSGWVPT